MNPKAFNEFCETTNRTVDNSNLIEKMYKRLAVIELEKGESSKEYKDLYEFLKHSTKLEYEIIKKIISTSFSIYFMQIIKSKDCNRLLEIVRNDYDLYEKVLINEYKEEYESIKDDIENPYPQEEYVSFKLQRIDNNLVIKGVLNLKKDKMYINILDYYIKTVEDEKVKEALLNEKYNTINRNRNLEKWFFEDEDNIDCLLVESDSLIANRLEMDLKDFLSLKSMYYNNSFELIIDELLDNHINNETDKILYETNMLSILLCMNILGLKDSYENIEFDIKNNPELYDEKEIDFIESIYGKYPILEKKIRPKITNSEVI